MRVSNTLRLCRDPDDDVVIETALRGVAVTLVPRDDDLKGDTPLVEALAFASVEMLSVRRFLAALEDER